jgi:copper transport protein
MQAVPSRRSFTLSVLFVLTLLLTLNPVSAHGYLLRSIPEDRAVLDRAPVRLQYWFSEGLEPRFTNLTVRDASGATIATGGVSQENNALLTARLPRNLPDGAYIVDMRIAFASDGHVIAQSRVFFVGKEVGGVNGHAALNQANPLEAIWRTITLSSTMLLFGLCILYSTILVPAWGSKSYPAGLLPPRVMSALNRFMLITLVVTFAGNLLAILQQSMVFFDADMGQVISQSLWSVVRVGTRFGDLWSARMLLLLLVSILFGLSIYLRTEQPETVRPFWTANGWALLLVIGTFSAGSHAAGSIIWPWVATFNDWLHAIGVGLWVGGLAALALILPSALAPYQGDQRRQALLAVMKRFSRLASGCVFLVIATGIYSAVTWVYTPSDVTGTPFGSALLLKLLLVSGLLFIAIVHHMALQPVRFARFQSLTQRVQTFVPSLRLESLIAFAVLASVGLLSATPVPIPYFIEEEAASPTATQQLGDLSITLTITPGGPGVNTYDTLITRNGQPLDNLSMSLQMVNPARDQRSAWETTENADNGLYITTGAQIDRAGTWWSLLDLKLSDGTTQRAAFSWDITDAASVQQSQPPRLQHLIALALVIAAIGWMLYPSANWLYHRLDLRPATLAVALGAIVATTIFTIIGVILIQNTEAEYEATLNPIPQFVNPNLPDALSIERGKTLYESSCPTWKNTDQTRILERLPTTRDEKLFLATAQSWQIFPACDSTLQDSQRWDIVNFIRTFQRK